MIKMTSTMPISNENLVFWIASRPSVGPTSDCDRLASGAGIEPVFSTATRSSPPSPSCATSVPPIVICARPPRIALLIIGADLTLSSRMVANFMPTICEVTSPNTRPPKRLNSSETTGRFVVGS